MEKCEKCFTCQNCFTAQSEQVEGQNYGLTFIVTKNCNMHCPYCWVSTDKSFLTAEQMKRAFDIVSKRGKVSVGFFGGEPLLYFDEIKNFTDMVKGNPNLSSLNITTNGILINDEIIKWIKENNVGFIFSYDGSLAQKLVRGNDDILREKVIRMGKIPRGTLRMTCTPELVPYIPHFFEFGVSCGYKHLVIEPTTGNNEDYDVEALEYYLRQSFRLWVQILLNGYYINYKPLIDGIKMQLEVSKGRYGCGNSPFNFCFSTDLKFYGCHRYATNQKGVGLIGDLENGINEELLKEHTDSVDYNKIQSPYFDCKTCLARACIGGCIAGNLEDTGDKHKPSRSYCQFTRTICEIMKDVIKDDLSVQLILNGFNPNIMQGLIWRKVMTGSIGYLEEI